MDLKRRGLESGPKLAVGDGALGFWSALREVFPGPGTKEQRCWFHKAGNVLDKMPKSVQSKAKAMVREMWQAPTKEAATAAYRHFVDSWSEKYPKAVECLRKDEEVLFTFYDFPAAHWAHIRTSNPIESTYATVRLATDKTNQRMRVQNGNAGHGLEAGDGGPEDLASVDGIPENHSRDGWKAVRRRGVGRGSLSDGRRVRSLLISG